MLSNKEIIEKFDIPKSTLYGWKTERPKVYEYLATADEQFLKYRATCKFKSNQVTSFLL